MDSFFSLFDPSDGCQKQSNKKKVKPEQDNVKKKTEVPKGRRRGRKSTKSETIPEESSFLCDPDLSTELLVKDCSYIENFIEINKRSDDTDKRPKRRNSARKNRRKKTKVSPAEDLATGNAWHQDTELDNKLLNNQSNIPKISDENIGKNVNNLNDFKCYRRKNSKEDDAKAFQQRAVYNVIDKLEKVGLKDDMYLAGDFNTEDLENDTLYSSDDLDESYEDTSEAEDSVEEAYGSLPPEPRFGNVEYKLQLVAPCERRFQHLVTQLKWRLRSGGGSAVYVIGVQDSGALRGLRARALRMSLCTVRRMAAALRASVAHVTARRVADHRAVAEVYIRKLADTQQSVELRVAVMGANEAGKSTLIGVLTQGELDNGRGSARLNMFRHLHEVKSGRTSSLSHEILGFDAQGNVVNYGCSELMTAERIGERSAKLVSFLDLAGHSKYQRTTLHGLTGYSPDYAMLVISATAGITPITVEHIDLLLALDLPFFVVISKCDIAATIHPLMAQLADMLHPANKKPLLITDENLARNCVAPQKLILDSIDKGEESKQDDEQEMDRIAVFPVSSVRGAGVSSLHAYLLALQPPPADLARRPEDETCEFQIDEIFQVGESIGPVVGGLLVRGQLFEGDELIIGPLETGEFVPISVRTIYRNRVPHGCVRAGQPASLGLARRPPVLRPGMVLLAVPDGYGEGNARKSFGTCLKNEVTSLIQKKQNSPNKNRKNVRRKNKNLMQDLEKVENSLIKEDNIEETNLYTKSDSDGEKGLEKGSETGVGDEKDCKCCGEVLLEDPNDPRGCIYFQASVHVLRHATAIWPGFQCTVHIGNVRQTAIIEGIMSYNSELRAGESASVVFKFSRCPEYLVRGRRLLLTAGLGTRAIGRITQTFPFVP